MTVTVLIMAPRDRAVEASLPTPGSGPTPTGSMTPPTVSPDLAPPQVTADGCLGGAIELNRAVISAQEQAPLTSEGAAAFTATLMRWANASPAPAYKADTAIQILAQDPTAVVRDWVSAQNPANVSTTANFSSGRFYVESYTPTRALVSYLATGREVRDGVSSPPLTLSGAVTLIAQNGTWHFQDVSNMRDVSDLQAVSSPYTGGC